MTRRLAVAVLYVLLLCLQQEGYRHGLDHLRAELAQAHERALQLPAEACDECALLAGSAHALSGAAAVVAAEACDPLSPPSRAVAFAPAAARYYAARAPPLSFVS